MPVTSSTSAASKYPTSRGRPPNSADLRIPEQRYEVFAHGEHIAAIRRTWFTIWNTWLPESAYQVAEAPEFGRYGNNSTPHRRWRA